MGRARARAVRGELPLLEDLGMTRALVGTTNQHAPTCKRFLVSTAETIGRRATMEDVVLVQVRGIYLFFDRYFVRCVLVMGERCERVMVVVVVVIAGMLSRT